MLFFGSVFNAFSSKMQIYGVTSVNIGAQHTGLFTNARHFAAAFNCL